MNRFLLVGASLSLCLWLASLVCDPSAIEYPGQWEFRDNPTTCAYHQCQAIPAATPRFQARTGESTRVGEGKNAANVDVRTYRVAPLCARHLVYAQTRRWPLYGGDLVKRWVYFLFLTFAFTPLLLVLPYTLMLKRAQPPASDAPPAR